jgi:hypothetical protein
VGFGDLLVDATNSALIYPEMFLDVWRVLEDGYPVGPSFVNSLSTLVEAVVIHDRLFLQSNFDRKVDSPWRSFEASNLARMLRREGILVEPSDDELERWLSGADGDYNYVDFLTDSSWTPVGFLTQKSEAEELSYRIFSAISTYAPEAFTLEELVDDSEGGTGVDPKALPLLAVGFTVKDLIDIEGRNRKMQCYQRLSRCLGLHLYTLFQCAPHQLGAIGTANAKARAVFEQFQTKSLAILDTDDAVGDGAFRRIDIPPLCQIVLERCKGSRSAFLGELLSLRERHRNLRKYLGTYEKAWNAATTKEEARRLKAELNQAFENLAKLEASPTTRLLYRTWDIIKSPSKILEKLGDALVDKGKEYYAVDRIWGLHDFYKDLRESPLQKRNYALLESMFDRFAPEQTWSAASELAETVENRTLTDPTVR